MIQVPVGAKLIIDNTPDAVGHVISESNDQGEEPLIEGFEIDVAEGKPITLWEQTYNPVPDGFMQLSFDVPTGVSPEVAAMIVLGRLEEHIHEYGATQIEDADVIERMAVWWLARAKAMKAKA